MKIVIGLIIIAPFLVITLIFLGKMKVIDKEREEDYNKIPGRFIYLAEQRVAKLLGEYVPEEEVPDKEVKSEEKKTTCTYDSVVIERAKYIVDRVIAYEGETDHGKVYWSGRIAFHAPSREDIQPLLPNGISLLSIEEVRPMNYIYTFYKSLNYIRR